MGQWVLNRDRWYNTDPAALPVLLIIGKYCSRLPAKSSLGYVIFLPMTVESQAEIY